MQISSREADHIHTKRRKESNKSDDLVFIVGETNPLIFLNDFENCKDVTTEKEKLFKLRNFVNEEDKAEFSSLFFKCNWEAVRQTFLKKYAFTFTENKKKALNFGFFEETSLRSFVHRKMTALSTYTTLKLNNQMEMILAELPNEISNLFITNLKINASKSEILEFCESVQELVDGMNAETSASGNVTPTPQLEQQQQSEVVQDMEIFTYDSEVLSESSSELSSSSKRGRKSGGAISASRARGRPPKILKSIREDSGSSEFECMDSSQSEFMDSNLSSTSSFTND